MLDVTPSPNLPEPYLTRLRPSTLLRKLGRMPRQPSCFCVFRCSCFHLYVIWLLSLIALSVLAYSTLGIQEKVGTDLTFIKDEGNVLGEVIAPWFATFFFAAASIKLFSTNLGILDWVSRLTADSLKVSFLGESRFWSESKIYLSVVWIMITIGSVIILTGIEPVVLLIIASSDGEFVMASTR